MYINRNKAKSTYHKSESGTDIRNWNTVRIFTYKETKATTNNFKETIGCGSFGCAYKGKLTDGKLVAVKVWFDKTQLGADSFINEESLFISNISPESCLVGMVLL